MPVDDESGSSKENDELDECESWDRRRVLMTAEDEKQRSQLQEREICSFEVGED